MLTIHVRLNIGTISDDGRQKRCGGDACQPSQCRRVVVVVVVKFYSHVVAPEKRPLPALFFSPFSPTTYFIFSYTVRIGAMYCTVQTHRIRSIRKVLYILQYNNMFTHSLIFYTNHSFQSKICIYNIKWIEIRYFTYDLCERNFFTGSQPREKSKSQNKEKGSYGVQAVPTNICIAYMWNVLHSIYNIVSMYETRYVHCIHIASFLLHLSLSLYFIILHCCMLRIQAYRVFHRNKINEFSLKVKSCLDEITHH